MKQIHEQQQPQSFSYYWKFFWPLTLMGVSMILGRQFQNGVLARAPDAIVEIAIFAIASSTINFFTESFAFVPQMANVMVTGQKDRLLIKRFLFFLNLFWYLFLFGITLTLAGKWLLAWAYSLDETKVQQVCLYLLSLSPSIYFQSSLNFNTGLLIKFKKTGAVTSLTLVYLTVMIITLLVGFSLDGPLVLVLAGSQVLARVIQWGGSHLACQRWAVLEEQENTEHTFGSLWAFFWPVSLTSLMFSFSRPVLFALVSRMPESSLMIACLRLAFDAAVIFQNTMNQFRHLFITYASVDLKGVLSFMKKTALLVTILMLILIAAGPIKWVLVYLLQIPGHLADMTCQALYALSPIPILVSIRNYFHGTFMLMKKTKVMGFAGVVRVFATFLMAYTFAAFASLNHVTASFSLAFGFLTELLTNYFCYHIYYRKDNPLLCQNSL